MTKQKSSIHELEVETVDKPMIVVKNVDMVFNIANEQLNSLKEYFIALVRGKLFFREFKALENINFTVNKGDVYGIVGTNGSGKSTMLKLIAGVLEPTKGTCEINGSIAPLIELGAGFDPELTARENVYLNGSLLGYSKKFIDEHFDAIVEFAEVKDFIDMPLKNYSSGMIARIAFAIATATTPDILVVDEALSVGDFMFQEKCERRINDLVKNHGTTLLFVSHSIDQVERVCEKALWIEKGHKRLEGDVKDVCFAYRNMDYTDFVATNGIVSERPGSIEELRRNVSIAEITEALWRCAGTPSIGSHNNSDETPARKWARACNVIPADLDAFFNSKATRQDLADLIYSYAIWRKPSAAAFEPIDQSEYCDDLPTQESQRTSAEWCIFHRVISGTPNADGAMALAMQEPATFVDLAKTITKLYKTVFSYPHDVKLTDWYVLPGYFDYVIEKGYMSSRPDGGFSPNSPLPRAQAITVLWRCAGCPEASVETNFEDVDENSFYATAVSWALSCGIMNADDSQFRPEESVSRQSLALLLYRYVKLQAGKAATTNRADLSVFADVVTLPASHSTAMAWAIGNGLIETTTTPDGHKQIKPSDPATRATLVKAAAIVQRDIIKR